jgi:hypothetical protein
VQLQQQQQQQQQQQLVACVGTRRSKAQASICIWDGSKGNSSTCSNQQQVAAYIMLALCMHTILTSFVAAVLLPCCCCCCTRFVQECARRGLLVLLDMHRLAAASDIPELWYSAEYPEAAVLQGWKTMVLR